MQIVVAQNGFYPCSPERQTTMLEYIHENKLSVIHFDLVKDKGEVAMRTVENVLKDGKGITGLSPLLPSILKSRLNT